MSANQIKRRLRRALPGPLFTLIQKLRTLWRSPSSETQALKAAFESRQSICTGPDEIAMDDDMVLKISPESREPFEWFCWRSPVMREEFVMFTQRARGAASFVDVGANHGIYSLVFLKLNPRGTVISIDPSPIASSIRSENVRLNGFENRLWSHEVACGAESGMVSMHYNWHHLEVIPKGRAGGAEVQVPVRTLDALCAEHGMTPEIVKIDVEGFELDVLQGAEEVLKATRVLFLEVHPDLLDALKVPLRDIHDWLTVRGWRIKSLGGEIITARDFADRIHTFWTLCEK